MVAVGVGVVAACWLVLVNIGCCRLELGWCWHWSSLQDFCAACCVGFDSYGTLVPSAVAAGVDDALELPVAQTSVASLFI